MFGNQKMHSIPRQAREAQTITRGLEVDRYRGAEQAGTRGSRRWTALIDKQTFGSTTYTVKADICSTCTNCIVRHQRRTYDIVQCVCVA